MESNKKSEYKDMPSVLGVIRLVATDAGLAAILWEGEDYTRTKLSVPERNDQNPILLKTEQQLTEYFAKTRTTFDIPLDFSGTEFQKKVWKALLNVPFGKTITYGGLAKILGDIKAVRAVGGALNKNPVAIIVPCHRIVGATGKMVGFAGGIANKTILLNLENKYKMPSLFDQ
ncbi:methylated-DNA--[protein]-cysteine S-methyltransferase [Sphingobacterium spiritivorum]|uniref:Methylated-DNA--protein-cysteine methyltransferase n=1 Tax=Sphingobacterium spiritivorum ATCC 33861 TaxID=525373 RepID=D7VPW2_SPHSI|nr:methylated-DNA--[protein]-cysteine S-methyltransferase [Sphingobacterium spiritivorum]EFK57119.1 6-O-methylguanine DNA methyltransferase, DNA binding domain protein [Sphingobacterium spiritivorum ATCC 33861]QQT34887.1 methylated-DNA--[protein]-cysteine S-methyltransferase [Sphingobacterium spiritivorum]WQD35779.1 methylated-DNA--[protein]-cysteine S-methyltransferase [Sphingobacterium spiritivorum]SUJ01987.1 Methylated-DNA--protein-cysteine methyltransferase, constitutive [Sphingobacterium s